MFKKALYLGSLCVLAALASCGNSKNNEETLPAGDTAVVGEVVTEVAEQGDTIAAATAEVVDTITNAAPAADKDAAVKADEKAK